MSAFADLVAAFVDELFVLQPLSATGIGDHRFDDRWPDLSDAGRLARVAAWDRWTGVFSGVDPATLTADERFDRDLVLGELAAMRFAEAELREDAWDALAWVYLLGFGLHSLMTRDFAPLARRLTSFAGRLEGIPAVIAQAQEVLGSHPTRPVSRLHAQVAGARIGGIAGLVAEGVIAAEGAAPGDPQVAALLPRLRAAAAAATAVLEGIGEHLRTQVAVGAQGAPLLGRELFAAKLRHTLGDPTVTPEIVLARAEAEFARVRAEMVRLARGAWATYRPGEPEPADEGAAVRGVLDAIALRHPGPDELVDYCRAELARIEAFCRDHAVITLAEEPLEIVWTPEFLRSYAGAMLESPGPLDIGQKAFFSITPARDGWGPDDIESWLREMNNEQLRLLAIHEAVPGHYLQGVYSNRSASLARRVFFSGLFAEGWAVYVTQVMLDRGYGDGSVALWLSHWKYYLRAVVNAILDVRIHTMGMTSEEAIALMVEGGFQSAPRLWQRTSGRGSRPRSSPRTSLARWGSGTSRTRRAAGRPIPPGPVARLFRRRVWWAATRVRRALTSGRIWRPSSRMGRRRCRCFGGSSWAEAEAEAEAEAPAVPRCSGLRAWRALWKNGWPVRPVAAAPRGREWAAIGGQIPECARGERYLALPWIRSARGAFRN